MTKTIKRILIVAAVNLVTFELLMQLSVGWRESTEEKALLAQMFLLIIGLIWCVLPAFPHLRQSRRVVATAVSVVLLYVGFHATTFFYSWHIRPNIGLYEEPRWVSKHPAYQKQLRARIENSRWTKEK